MIQVVANSRLMFVSRVFTFRGFVNTPLRGRGCEFPCGSLLNQGGARAPLRVAAKPGGCLQGPWGNRDGMDATGVTKAPCADSRGVYIPGFCKHPPCEGEGLAHAGEQRELPCGSLLNLMGARLLGGRVGGGGPARRLRGGESLRIPPLRKTHCL